jgi:DNA-directed RNA polymerase subunit RPC12/RpoP
MQTLLDIADARAPRPEPAPPENFRAYECERCAHPCDAKAYTTCICSNCNWRVLTKRHHTLAAPRTYSTD